MLLYHEIKKLVKNRIIISVVSVLVIACAVLAFRTSLNVTPEENASADAKNAGFSAAMNRFIRDAEKTYENSAAYADGYTVEYYNECINAFTQARDNVVLPDGDAEGWGALLGFDMLFYACIIAAAVIGAVSLYEDRRTGARLIINAACKGGIQTAVSAVSAAVITSLLSFLLLCAVTVCSFALFSSLKGGWLPLQTATAYRYSPFLYTLAGAFLRLTARRALAVIAVTLISVFFSALVNGYIPVILLSAAFPAVEFVLFSAKYYAVDVFSQNVNLFAYGTSYLFKKYYTVRFFGCALPQIITFVVLLMICVSFAALTVPAYNASKRRISAETAFFKRPVFRMPSFKIFAKDHSLFFWELRKSVLKPSVIAVLSVCIVLGIVSVCKNAPKTGGGNSVIYREMCETTSEMTLDEARVWLGEISSGNNEYVPPEEDEEKYNEYVRTEIMQMQAKSLGRRLNTLIQYQTLGNVRLIYSEGYAALFQNDLNIYHIIAVLTVCAGIFSKENEANTLTIVRTYKNGRNKTFFIKLLTAVSLSALLYSVFSAAEFIAFYDSGITLHRDVIVASVMYNGASTLTLGDYMVLRYVIGFAAYVLFAAAVAAISAISGKTLFTLAGAGLLTLVPYAVRKTGDMPLFADISAYMSADAALQASGLSALYAFIPIIAVILILVIIAYQRNAAVLAPLL